MTEAQQKSLDDWRKAQDDYLVSVREFLAVYKAGDFKRCWRMAHTLGEMHHRHLEAWSHVSGLEYVIDCEEAKALKPEMERRQREFAPLMSQAERVLESLRVMGFIQLPGARA